MHARGESGLVGRLALGFGVLGAPFVVAALAVACAASGSVAPGAEAPTEETNVPARGSGWTPGIPAAEAQRATGQATIGEARRALDTAGESCSDACPALVMLRSGVATICRVAETKDDSKICRESRAELASNETRLRPSCGTCAPGGNSAPADSADASEGPPL
jgi:hypothetical protein